MCISADDSDSCQTHRRKQILDLSRSYRSCGQCLRDLRRRRCGRYSSSKFFRLQTVGILRAVLERLHVGANDIAHPADSGVAVDFVDASSLLAKAILQCFNCNIESDLVPELKTVGDGLRG